MKSQLTDEFVVQFRALPEEVRTLARKNYRLWKQDPYHPSLHFKRVHTQEPLYSIRIGRGRRALGLLEGDLITRFWVGSHAAYNRLI